MSRISLTFSPLCVHIPTMRLTVLVDNTTLTDRYLRGEPGLSIFLRDGEHQILFDCGFSDVLCANAAQLAGGR